MWHYIVAYVFVAMEMCLTNSCPAPVREEIHRHLERSPLVSLFQLWGERGIHRQQNDFISLSF
jgi:hypothetical protein